MEEEIIILYKMPVDELAQKIWDYHNIRADLKKSDLIFVLCSNDLRVAEYAAQLFLDGYAPYVLFSGGISHNDDVLKTPWNIPEAEKFAQVALKMGVSEDKILKESNSTNTGENILFSYELLKQKGIKYDSMILVQKPFMLRRTYATFVKQWPDEKTEIILTSPPISFQDYPNENISKEILIHTMVGDLQRIKIYPKMDYQIYQEIPDDIWSAYKKLVDMGYTKHLIK